MGKEKITILCGSPGLGFYIPGIIMAYQLQRKGFFTEVAVFENFILAEKKSKIIDTKTAFHRNFDVALMGQRLAKDVSHSLNPSLVSSLLAMWEREKRKKFIVFSGFWMPIITQYIQYTSSQDVSIDLCHVDAATSTSWSLYMNDQSFYRHIWFWNWEERKISYCLHISDKKPIPYHERNDRFVIHGGGWGIGTYQDKIGKLRKKG